MADPSESESDKSIAAFFQQFYSRQYSEALATASKVDVDEANTTGRAVTKAMRAAALVWLKRGDEALKLFAEADAAAPALPIISTLQFESGLYSDNIPVAEQALDRMISRMPDAVRELSMDGVSYFLRNEPKGQDRKNEDRRIALARLGFGGATGDYYTANAVEILTKRGQINEAGDLLAYVDDPVTIEDFLIQRRYAALWPKLEASVGDNLFKARESSVQASRKELEEDPESAEKLQFYLGALRRAGQLNAAIAFRSKLPATAEALASADSDTGWTFNEVALALHEAGRKDEADQVFARLNEATIQDDGWRISMIINRLELLVSDGRFEQAMPLIEPARSAAASNGNAYAQQLVRRLKYCALSGSGRKIEAENFIPELLKHSNDAVGPTVDALLCAGQTDRAEKLALDGLKTTEEFESSFVRRLQASPLTSDDPSIWAKNWLELRRRPAIAKEFERLGRDLPAQFLPPPPEPTDKPGSADLTRQSKANA